MTRYFIMRTVYREEDFSVWYEEFLSDYGTWVRRPEDSDELLLLSLHDAKMVAKAMDDIKDTFDYSEFSVLAETSFNRVSYLTEEEA